MPCSETAYVEGVQYALRDDPGIAIAPRENKMPLPFISDKNCEVLAHPYLFPTGKFGYTFQRGNYLSPCKYFNQRLLNYTQKFESDIDYIFFYTVCYAAFKFEQYHQYNNAENKEQ